VGGQRGLRRLSVTPIDPAHLDPPGIEKDGAEVPVSGTLQDAMAALLTDDSGRVRVVDASGRTVGTLTVEGVHASLRRSVHAGEKSTTPTAG
jgi:osmoprotectant transport system ATP-binding protein